MTNGRLRILPAARVYPLQRQVFADPSRRRKVVVRRGLAISVVALLTWGALFLGDIATFGPLKQLTDSRRTDAGTASQDIQSASPSRMPMLAEMRNPVSLPRTLDTSASTCVNPVPPLGSANAAVGQVAEPRVFAILPSSPDWTYLSLKKDCGVIDVLLRETFVLDAETYAVTQKTTDSEAQDAVRRFLRKPGTATVVFPTISIGKKVNKVGLQNRLANADFRTELARDIAGVANPTVRGMCLDVGGWPQVDASVLTQLLTELRTTLSATGHETCLIASANQGSLEAATVIDTVDRIVLGFTTSPGSDRRPRRWPLKHGSRQPQRRRCNASDLTSWSRRLGPIRRLGLGPSNARNHRLCRSDDPDLTRGGRIEFSGACPKHLFVIRRW